MLTYTNRAVYKLDVAWASELFHTVGVEGGIEVQFSGYRDPSDRLASLNLIPIHLHGVVKLQTSRPVMDAGWNVAQGVSNALDP